MYTGHLWIYITYNLHIYIPETYSSKWKARKTWTEEKEKKYKQIVTATGMYLKMETKPIQKHKVGDFLKRDTYIIINNRTMAQYFLWLALTFDSNAVLHFQVYERKTWAM